MKVDDTAAEVIVGFAALVGMGFFIWAGRLSDRIGRKKPIVWGYGVTLVLLFQRFWWMGSVGNPALSAAAARAPVTVTGSDRKSVVSGKSVSVRVELGGSRIIKQKTTQPSTTIPTTVTKAHPQKIVSPEH